MVIRQFYFGKRDRIADFKWKRPYWKQVVVCWEIWLDLSRKIYLICYRNINYKKERENLIEDKEETKKKTKAGKKKQNNHWIYVIFLTTFILALIMGAIADTTVQNLNLGFAIFILCFIIAIGIGFDMVGMSVASADEVVFHAQATKRQKGAAEAIRLVKYSEKVSSVCNDVIGDVCGIISGSVSALIALQLANILSLPNTMVSLIMGALVASITVGGKAVGKSIAARNAEKIIGMVGKWISYILPAKNKKVSK